MAPHDHVQLLDGRRLDLRVTGPEDGLPVVWHHGTPGAAVQPHAFANAAHARGLRLLTISRPGYGDSSRRPGRSVLDVVEDIAAALDAIGAERCLVAGVSGGGPHALACAARLDAAKGALVIAGVAPFNAEGLDWMAGMGESNVMELTYALEDEAALRRYTEGRREARDELTVDALISSISSLLPEVDRAVLTDQFGEDVIESMKEALRVRVDGWVDDDFAFVKPWGFDLDEISIPTMIWQGSEDLMVPFAHGEWLAAHVPGASVHLEQGEGHLSIREGAADRMLDELVAAAGAG